VYPTDPTELLLSDLAYAEAAMRAQAEGFDAVLIAAAANYGIASARAALDIPLMDCGQASILAAAAAGDRFGIVTIWPQTMSFVYDRLLREVPAGRQCVSVRYVSTAAEQATLADGDNFLTQMKAGREHMIERIVAEIEASVRDGAQSVVLGCNCMTPVAGVLSARSSVPVIDPTAAGYQCIQSMLALGLCHSRDQQVPASTRQPVLARMLLAGQPDASAEPEDCPVCVLGDDGATSCEPADLVASEPVAR
jgi:allantoin racemase